MSSEPLLSVRGLAKRFGGFRALDGLDLTLGAGEILGLVGPNGSGKTTCINAISGLVQADGGSVRFAGAEIRTQAPHRRVRSGINRTFQVPKAFLALTARQNIEVAAAYGGRDHGPLDPEAILDQVDLGGLGERPAAELTSGQQKLLDLGRALATRPRLLLVDELAAGLNPRELDRMAERLRGLAASGIALIVVEHLLGFIDQLTARVLVMSAGRAIFEGSLAAATRDPVVLDVFLGAPDDDGA